METIFSEYLTKIERLEKNSSSLVPSDFEELKNEVLSHLDQGYRTRFSRLKFINYPPEDFTDDIPF